MPKNKGKYKSQEAASTAVDPSDVVLDFWDRVGKALNPHKTKLIAALAALIVLSIGVSIWRWLDNGREQKATLGFQSVMAVQNARIVAADTPTDSALPGEDPDAPKYKSAEERSTAALAAIDKLDKDFGSTDVAEQATVVKAGVLYDLGRYDDAMAAYRKALASDSGALKYVAREGLGLSIEAKALAAKDAAARTAGLDQALAEYKQLQPDAKAYYHDVAVYHQARVLALKGDKPGAVALYKQIVETMPQSPVVGEARDRLALLEE